MLTKLNEIPTPFYRPIRPFVVMCVIGILGCFRIFFNRHRYHGRDDPNVRECDDCHDCYASNHFLVRERAMNSKNKAFLPLPMNLMGKVLWKDLIIRH